MSVLIIAGWGRKAVITEKNAGAYINSTVSSTMSSNKVDSNTVDTGSKSLEKSTMKNNSKQLRLSAEDAAKQVKAKTLEDEIKNRLIIAWGEWQPDYEGWVNWSNSLYAEDATISAIGNKQQNFRDYQKSMKLQRDACEMEMGPIMQIVVKDNVAALVYHMYLTPKNVKNAPTIDMLVTEFNTLKKVNGKLMVTHLDLYTDGGGMTNR